MAADRTWLSGRMGMLIMRLLSEKDMYGYEMIDTLRKRSQNVFELKAGTLNPLLHGLEEKHYLTSYEQEALGKVRKYYRITDAGRKHLEQFISEQDQLLQVIAFISGKDVEKHE